MRIWYTLAASSREELALQLNRCEEFGLTIFNILDSTDVGSTIDTQPDYDFTVVAYASDSRKALPRKPDEILKFQGVTGVHGPREDHGPRSEDQPNG